MIHEVRMRIAHILVQAVKKIRQALLSTDDGGFYRPERVVEVKPMSLIVKDGLS